MKPESKQKKAFLVSFEFEIPVLAENADMAKEFMDSALGDLCLSDIESLCTVRPFTSIPGGLEDRDLVYCDDDDVTVKELCDHSPEYQATLAKFKKYTKVDE